MGKLGGVAGPARDLFGRVPEICTAGNSQVVTGLERMEDRALRRFTAKHYALIEKLKDVGLPAKGEQIRLVTKRRFNAIQWVAHIAEQERIEDLRLVIYSINYYAAKILINLIDSGKISEVEILMSNLRNKAHREKEDIIRNEFITHPRISLFFCSSHAKSISCRTELGNHYTLEGSGNMADNSRIEQYVLDNDEGLYQFTRDWMTEIRVFLRGTPEFSE